MNSIPCPCIGRAPRWAWLAGSILAVTYVTAAVAQPNSNVPAHEGAAATVTAQWQPYDLRFHYFGFTTYYSCSGLEDRLEQLLKDMGADQDVRVSVSGCFCINDVSNMLTARIRVRMPVTEDSTSSATHDAQGASFSAVSKPVELRSSRSGQMGSGDCELLEQVRDQLLPALKLQLIKDNLTCLPGQVSFRHVLQVRALIPETPAKP